MPSHPLVVHISMNSVVIVDYGMGNLRSVSKALEHVAPLAQVRVTGVPEQIQDADRVILPGVGAIRDCMRELQARGLIEAIQTCTRDRPFLGICLGMQALFEFSEENDGVQGLGILPGRVARFPTSAQDGDRPRLKVPHMGWNQVCPTQAHPLWHNVPRDNRFYFVHSYYAIPTDAALVTATATYGTPFACAVGRDNLFAVQFHPEKSQRVGLALLKNFMNWDGQQSLRT